MDEANQVEVQGVVGPARRCCLRRRPRGGRAGRGARSRTASQDPDHLCADSAAIVPSITSDPWSSARDACGSSDDPRHTRPAGDERSGRWWGALPGWPSPEVRLPAPRSWQTGSRVRRCAARRALGRQPEGGVRRLRRLRPGPAGRPPDLPRASTPCSTAARSRPAWRSATARPSPSSRTWASSPTCSTTARSPPSTGHLAIGHTRYSTTGSCTWRNAQPVYRGVGDRQFALGHNGNLINTEALAEEAGMLPGTVASDSDLVAELLAAELAAAPGGPQRRARPRAALAARAAPPRGRLLPRGHGREPRHRRPRPQRLPAAVPRPARGRLGAGLGEPGARHRRRPLRPRARARRDGGHRRHRPPVAAALPRRAGRPASSACSSSSTSPGPTPGSTARASTTPASAWASCSPSRRPSRPTW